MFTLCLGKLFLIHFQPKRFSNSLHKWSKNCNKSNKEWIKNGPQDMTHKWIKNGSPCINYLFHESGQLFNFSVEIQEDNSREKNDI